MKKKELKIPNLKDVYRIIAIDANGKEVPTSKYRVRKRIKIDGRWSSQSQTFDSLNEAKAYASAPVNKTTITVLSKNGHLFQDVY